MDKILILHGMAGSPEDFRYLLDRNPLSRALVLDQDDFFAASEYVDIQIETFQPRLICAYSMGGRIAIHALAKRLKAGKSIPKLGLLLVGAGLGYKTEEEKQKRRSDDIRWSKLLESDPQTFWKNWYMQPLFSLGERANDAAHWLARRKASNSEETARFMRHLVHFSPTVHDYLLPDLLNLVVHGISTLYMAGERDKKYADLAKELAFKGIDTTIVPGVGHAIPLEKPESLAEALSLLKTKLE